MFCLSDDDRAAFALAVEVSAREPAHIAAVRDVYAQFEVERIARSPRCDASGACCRFEAYGHRLFVTTLEMAAFVATPGRVRHHAWDGTGCPHQVDGRCGAREARPFGCRVYFCDRSSIDWQQEQYERFHGALRELHERLNVPYVYAEWRDALFAVADVGVPSASPGDRLDGASSEPVGKRRIVLTVVPGRR